MQILIAASPKVAIPSILALKSEGHALTIVTQSDKPAGRGLKLKATPIADFFSESIKIQSEDELRSVLVGKDLLITIGFGRILKEETLNIPKYGGINLHFSLLPRWRGAAPVQRAIEAGDRESGVTVFQMDSGMDSGPIWVQKRLAISHGMNAHQLFDELSTLGSIALLDAIKLIEEDRAPFPQHGEITIARKIDKAEARIDWNDKAIDIVRKIKAFAENPVATAKFRGEFLKILDAHEVDIQLKPGELAKGGIVGTSNGSIQLISVAPAGKKTMPVKDWLNGLKLTDGEFFE